MIRPSKHSVPTTQEAPGVTFRPDFADGIAEAHVAAFTTAEGARIDGLTVDGLRELLAKAARDGYAMGFGVAA